MSNPILLAGNGDGRLDLWDFGWSRVIEDDGQYVWEHQDAERFSLLLARAETPRRRRHRPRREELSA